MAKEMTRSKNLWLRERILRMREDGSVLPFFALVLTVMMGAAGLCLDLGNWYLQTSRMQRAADAAALTGSVYLPGNVDAARTAAKGSLTQNQENPSTAVINQSTANPYTLDVTVQRTVKNYFMSFFGLTSTSFSRAASGEYRPFIPMGSPSNVLGIEPDPTDLWESSGKTNAYWLNISGGATPKGNGDRWDGGVCASGVDLCSTSTPAPLGNSDYIGTQTFVIHIPTGITGNFKLQAFDPGLNDTGDYCDTNFNNFTPADAADPRYQSGIANQYCTGDEFAGSAGQEASTTYELWTPEETFGSSHSIGTTTCSSKTYPGYSGSLGTQLQNPTFRASFRKWVDICSIYIGGTFAPGDYLLKVKTPTNKWSMNRYGLRAGFMTSATEVDKAKTSQVSLYAKGQLVIYALRQSSNVDFYLARLRTSASGHDLELNLFDIGDASQPVGLTVLPPSDARVNGNSISSFANCEYTRPGNTSLYFSTTNCGISGMTSSTHNGKLVKVKIPIPPGYSCNDNDPNACWTRIRLSYASGQVNDTTSWQVRLAGQPVRLVPAGN